MCVSTRSTSLALPENSASSSLRSETLPATSAATIGGSARTTGICETPYSWRMCTASAMVSLGWVCTRSGMPAALAAQHLADASARSVAGRKPYWLSHSSLKTLAR